MDGYIFLRTCCVHMYLKLPFVCIVHVDPLYCTHVHLVYMNVVLYMYMYLLFNFVSACLYPSLSPSITTITIALYRVLPSTQPLPYCDTKRGQRYAIKFEVQYKCICSKLAVSILLSCKSLHLCMLTC